MQKLILSNYTLSTAAGNGQKENITALINKNSGLIENDFLDVDLKTWIGRVKDIENQKLPLSLKNYQCRNNQLAYLALQQDDFISSIDRVKKKIGADRIGVFLGTSTSGFLSTELAYRELINHRFKTDRSIFFKEQHNSFSIADFVQQFFKLKGPAQVISTACSSSAKVFASASRYIELGLCDAAIVGGVDSLCYTTLYGFNALGLLSSDVCRPADQSRKGLSIGEAAGFVLLEKATPEIQMNNVTLVGYGESSDAYHMSTPHPEGRGAIAAMQEALLTANLTPHQIDYINLHGTATLVNDRVEDRAIYSVFGSQTKSSSIKGLTGHTLGAAGAVEAIFSAFCLQNNFIPASFNTNQVDNSFKSHILLENSTLIPLDQKRAETSQYIASNSFGFGGNNCCLIFGQLNSNEKYV